MGPTTPTSTPPPMASMLGIPDLNPDIMQGILTGVYDVPGLRPVFHGPSGFHKARVVNDASKVDLVSEVSPMVKKVRWFMEAEVTMISQWARVVVLGITVVLTFL